jgi:phosphohistidine swiveling domain-containing protein
MDSPIHFTKTLERDATLFVQGSWAQGLDIDLAQRFGINNPYRPMVLHYATAESLQIWENMTSVQWMLDAFFERHSASTVFIEQVIDEYIPLLEELRGFWSQEVITTKEDIERYTKLVRRASLNISTCYYAGMDTRTPQAVLDRVVRVREEDVFYSRNDEFVRACVAAKNDRLAQYAAFVLPHELFELPSEDECMVRAQGTVLVAGTDLYVETIEHFATQHPEYIFDDLKKAVDLSEEVKGQIAFRGKVSGRVVIVRNQRQMAAVQEGDIMVTPMTTPDFLPAMKMATAFVTDEGGITCHAAIVAREMKKPCIIGTKTATQVLHDGDLVEVDAEKGVVRVIQRLESGV